MWEAIAQSFKVAVESGPVGILLVMDIATIAGFSFITLRLFKAAATKEEAVERLQAAHDEMVKGLIAGVQKLTDDMIDIVVKYEQQMGAMAQAVNTVTRAVDDLKDNVILRLR